MKIDAKGKNYKQLNEEIRTELRKGKKMIELLNVNGQRYIGNNLADNAKIIINGVPGNDLAFAMIGPHIEIHGNGQDGVANTMSAGKVIFHGSVGDICGYAMRGGFLYIKGNVGYRSGIHMKEYKANHPTIVIGGKAGDFLGEYMAGGILVVLDLFDENDTDDIVGNLCGTGMHGGRMFIRGKVEDWRLGKEVKVVDLDENDIEELKTIIDDYSKELKWDIKNKINYKDFIKLIPGSKRPYGRLYAY